MSTKSALVSQLNALLRLTNTEIMIAESRRGQATTSDIERELAANADKGRERAELLSTSIRDLGGVPDVVGVAAGRLSASAKATIEQGQDLLEALLGDLALEHELLDRTASPRCSPSSSTSGQLGARSNAWRSLTPPPWSGS